MSNEAEVARMHAQLEADMEMASAGVLVDEMARWMRSPEGKRKLKEAQEVVFARWRHILELEEDLRDDDI